MVPTPPPLQPTGLPPASLPDTLLHTWASARQQMLEAGYSAPETDAALHGATPLPGPDAPPRFSAQQAVPAFVPQKPAPPNLFDEWQSLLHDFPPSCDPHLRQTELVWDSFLRTEELHHYFDPSFLASPSVQQLYLAARAARNVLQTVQDACPPNPEPLFELPCEALPPFAVARNLSTLTRYLAELRMAAALMARHARSPSLRTRLLNAAQTLTRAEGQIIRWLTRHRLQPWCLQPDGTLQPTELSVPESPKNQSVSPTLHHSVTESPGNDTASVPNATPPATDTGTPRLPVVCCSDMPVPTAPENPPSRVQATDEHSIEKQLITAKVDYPFTENAACEATPANAITAPRTETGKPDLPVASAPPITLPAELVQPPAGPRLNEAPAPGSTTHPFTQQPSRYIPRIQDSFWL